MEVRSKNPQETEKFAKEVAERIMKEGKQKEAVVLALSGELGAGKTAFAKGFAKALGIQEEVTSPTFVIEKTYGIPGDLPFKRLVHIDAYRLGEKENLHAIGFPERFKNPENIVLLEWPEQIQKALPEHARTITFTHVSENERVIAHA